MIEPTAANVRKPSFAWAWILGGAIIVAALILARHRPASSAANPSSDRNSAAVNAMASPSPHVASAATDEAPGKVTAASPDKESVSSNSRLAPPGTFYMVDYVSAKTPKGVVGFEPGRTVKLVEVHRDQGTLTVTDGQYQADVQPSQLTNDLSIADLARDRDAVSQRKLADYQTAALRAYQAIQKKTDENYSKNVERSNADIKASSAVGGVDAVTNPLNAAPSPTGTVVTPGVGYGSPYSYFAPNAVNAAPRTVVP